MPRGVDSLLFLHVNSTVFLQWSSVQGADRYEVSRLFYGKRTVPAETTSYSWPDDGPLFDRRGTTVHPEFALVKAMAGSQVLRTFSGGQPCPTLMFVAARGSGQNGLFGGVIGGGYAEGLGSRGHRVWDLLKEGLDTTSVDLPAVPVDYPAVAVAVDASGTVEPGNLPVLYRHSVEAGVADTKAIVDRSLARCPDIDIVLFGFSQGAQVVGDAFSQLPSKQRARIVRLILLADPQYHPADPAVAYLPEALGGHGIKGERKPMPDGKTYIESWCSPRDFVCHLGATSRQPHGSVYDTYEEQAANNASHDIQMRVRPPRHQHSGPSLGELLKQAKRP